jgi:hypothetical protein
MTIPSPTCRNTSAVAAAVADRETMNMLANFMA